MASKPKIKILDNSDLREQIDQIHEESERLVLVKLAEFCALRVLKLGSFSDEFLEKLEVELKIFDLIIQDLVSVHEIRQAGFRIHALARECDNDVDKTALRTLGQAIGVGHMKEHAMVCSDYAIKTVELYSDKDLARITEERNVQLAYLVGLNSESTKKS